MLPRSRPLLLLLVLCCSTFTWASAPIDESERPGSPYFVVEGGDPTIDRLPLESTDVDITVVGVIADVRVRQVYVNQGERAINTQYVFPGSTRAAVHGLVMRVGERQVRAQIKEKAVAQREFDQAKEEGKTASLLTEQRPNVFTMNLANVMPGDRIEVQLQYAELLVPESGVYEVVFPTVVGPRYSSPSKPAESWFGTPVTHAGKEPKTRFSLRTRISAGTPVADVVSPSHKLSTSTDATGATNVTLKDATGDRDVIVRYRLSSTQVSSGLVLSAPEDGEGFFLLTVEPPRRVNPAMIPARDYLFVVDVSGSMMGFPLDTAKAVVKALATQLRATDTFNILFFSGGSQTMAPAPVPATPENIARAMAMMSRIDGGGGTELLPALHHAFSMPRFGSLSRSVIVVTDGYVTVEREALELISSHLGESNLFAFGIGSSVNRYLIEAMARAGRGTPFIVTDASQATQVAEALTSYIRSPVLTNVKVSFNGFEVHDVEPAAVPDVLAERPVVVQGKWSGEPHGTVTVSGVTGAGPFSQTFEVSSLKPRPENAALKYLWARERIARLSDYAIIGESTEAERTQVTELGLKYELLTKYTSFIAVLEDVRNHGAAATDVEQPLPLPAGVSESAVGGSTGAEPDFLVMMALMAVVVGFALRRRSQHQAAA